MLEISLAWAQLSISCEQPSISGGHPLLGGGAANQYLFFQPAHASQAAAHDMHGGILLEWSHAIADVTDEQPYNFFPTGNIFCVSFTNMRWTKRMTLVSSFPYF